MPTYTSPGCRHEIGRNALILDTCVLVAAFWPKDEHHEHASAFIAGSQVPLLVPVAALVEAWGMIVGSCHHWQGALELLGWVTTPGSAELLPQDTQRLPDISEAIMELRVDCVGALISHLADDISRQWGCEPYIVIATYDTRHFWQCRERANLQLGILDLRTDSALARL